MFVCFPVDADEIRRLGKRFKKLDADGSGALSVQEFMSVPELQQNPLVQRVIDIFDTDGNGEIDFKGEWIPSLVRLRNCLVSEFIGGISQFSVKGDKESKLKCKFDKHLRSIEHGYSSSVAFKIYDIDKDGFISNGNINEN